MKLNRRRRFVIGLSIGFVIGAILQVLQPQINTLLGNLPASSILPFIAALLPFVVFVNNESKSRRDARRAQWRKIKSDVLDRWSINDLGRVTYTDGKVYSNEPTDPTAYADLPPDIRAKIETRFPELLRAWNEAKDANRQLNRDMRELYEKFQNGLVSLRKAWTLPDFDSESPAQSTLYPKNLFVSVYAQATARFEGMKIGQPFTFQHFSGDSGDMVQLWRGGLLIASGAVDICQMLKFEMERFIESKEIQELLGKIKAKQDEILTSPTRIRFEQELKKALIELEWR